MGKIPTRYQLPRILILGMEGVVSKFHLFVQILIIQFQPLYQSPINIHQLSQQLVILLKIDASLSLANPFELDHQHFFCDLGVEHSVGFGID